MKELFLKGVFHGHSIGSCLVSAVLRLTATLADNVD